MKFGNLDIELITVYAPSNVTVIFKNKKFKELHEEFKDSLFDFKFKRLFDFYRKDCIEYSLKFENEEDYQNWYENNYVPVEKELVIRFYQNNGYMPYNLVRHFINYPIGGKLMFNGNVWRIEGDLVTSKRLENIETEIAEVKDYSIVLKFDNTFETREKIDFFDKDLFEKTYIKNEILKTPYDCGVSVYVE